MGRFSSDPITNGTRPRYFQIAGKVRQNNPGRKMGQSVETSIKELYILPFDKRLEYLRNILVFKALNNLAQNFITALLIVSNYIHNSGTRNAKYNLILPKVRTSMAKNTFKFSAARSWKESIPKRH